MERSGKCLCGAVQFVAKDVKSGMSACHCSMCRRWAGGPFLAVTCSSVEWSVGAPKVRQTSGWAERGHCSECGSALFYRITAEGPYQGATTIAHGTLDDASGFTIAREYYIDLKPDGYAFEGERETLTEAQIQAAFGGG